MMVGRDAVLQCLAKVTRSAQSKQFPHMAGKLVRLLVEALVPLHVVPLQSCLSGVVCTLASPNASNPKE